MRHLMARKSNVLLLASGVLLVSGLLADTSRGAVARTSSAVILSYFNVVWDSDLEAVSISWGTAAEFDVAGFTVERAIWPSGTFTQTGELIPAIGDQVTGVAYGPLFDIDVITGTTYWYQLVIYDGGGQADRSIPKMTVVAGNLHVFLPIMLNGG